MSSGGAHSDEGGPAHFETRWPAIDAVKGLAVLGVVLIHARTFVGTATHEYLIDRAVPVFLVLFGCNAELWMNRLDNGTRAWIAARCRRLLPSYWSAVLVWWVLAWATSYRYAPVGFQYLAASFVGYAPWIQPYWFVALLFQFVVVWPPLHRIFQWAGMITVAAAVAVVLIASVLFRAEIIQLVHTATFSRPGSLLYYDSRWSAVFHFVIFSPAFAWHVVAGAWMARVGILERPDRHVAWAAMLFVQMLLLNLYRIRGTDEALALQMLADPLLTILLLATATVVAKFGTRLLAPLCFLGSWSWGIYLAHVLVHQGLEMNGQFWRMAPGVGSRAAYAVFLLASGVVIAYAAEQLRARAVNRRAE